MSLIAIIAINTSANAATYYVSPTGSDTNAGTATGTAWKTINHAASVAAAGDTVSIMPGTYRESATVTHSGLAGSPITFTAYSGAGTVTISGADVVSSWLSYSTNVYCASFTTSLGTSKQVFVGGVMKPEARWPNATASYPMPNSKVHDSPPSDWSYVATAGYTGAGSNWITDPNLPTRVNGYWNGAVMHTMSGYGWLMQAPSVTGYTDSTKTLTTTENHGTTPAYALTTATGSGATLKANEYYLSGIKGEMDSAGEWFYEPVPPVDSFPATPRLYIYSTTTPTNVEAKQRQYGFSIVGKSYINFTNLNFFACTIQTCTVTLPNPLSNPPTNCASYCTFNGLNMKYTGFNNLPFNPTDYTVDVQPYGIILGSHCVLQNSTLAYDSSALVTLIGDNISVINNVLHDSCFNPYWTQMIFDIGTGNANYLSHNTCYNAGRGIIGFEGKKSIIEYNNLYNGMVMCSDGGIFSAREDGGNAIFCYNEMHDCPGPVGHTGAGVEGFYADAQNTNWIAHHNLIWNIPGNAMQVNARQNYDMIFNNSLWNFGTSLRSDFDIDGPSGSKYYNNLLSAIPQGQPPKLSADRQLIGTALTESDLRYNLTYNPLFVSPPSSSTFYTSAPAGAFSLQSTSPGRSTGTVIPGVADTHNPPDMGALQTGDADWTTTCGSQASLVPYPYYNYPTTTYANQVVNGGFETSATSILPSYATTGSQYTILNSDAWTDGHLRSGKHAVAFTTGTSEIYQTVTGLLPNQRYTVYAGILKTDTNAGTVVKLGARNFGYPGTVQTVVPQYLNTDVNDTNPLTNSWQMTSHSFITGPGATSAQIYVDVTIPSGDTTAVSVDDLGLVMSTDFDPLPVQMPIAHYAFNESGTATVAQNASTSGLDGTVNGTVAWGGGILNNALTFNGSSTYVSCPAIATPSELTVACWAKSATSTWNAYGCLISSRPSFVLHPEAGSKDVRAIVYSGGVATQIYFRANTVDTTIPFDITKWHHYAIVYSKTAGILSIYVDGVRRTSINYTGTLDQNTGAFDIGQDNGVAGRFFNGQIDDVRIYDRALTDNQMAALGEIDPSELMHMKFDEGTGSGAGTKVWNCAGNAPGVFMGTTGPTWVTGKANNGDALVKALNFDGASSYVSCPALPISPTALTLSCWANSTDPTWNDYGCLVSSPVFMLIPDKGTKNIKFYIMTGGVWKQVSTSYALTDTFDPTGWHYYTGVYDPIAQTIQIYVDGVIRATLSATGNIDPTTGGIDIGHNYGYGPTTRILKGQIDDVRIFSRALAWDEVLNLYSETTGKPY